MAKKILVVDDAPDFLEMMKTRLEANSYSVITISDTKEVLPTAEKEIPDLILLDIVMPDMDGYQICARLKQEEKTRNIPIIFLTGKELEPQSIKERCIQLGVKFCLLKPVDAKELLTKIEEVLKETGKEGKMDLKEIKEKAKKLGIEPKVGMKKENLIHAIQTAEGNFSCFATAKDHCDQSGCCFRNNCLPKNGT